MKKLLIATRNKGKFLELSHYLSDLPIQLLSLSDLGITADVKETGKTYQENSRQKALYYVKKSRLPVIADDGGIEISALNNAPGTRSRRWLGHEATDKELIEHMKHIAKTLPNDNRNARFVAMVSFALPDGKVWSEEGVVEGIISKKPFLKHLKGYPYRSFFYLPEIKKFYHENDLTEEEQTLYNHRYKAIQKLNPIIRKALNLK